MHPVYGEAQGNGLEAQRIYQECYPERQLPQLEIDKRTAGRARTVRTPDLEETVLDTIGEKPSSSTRTNARPKNNDPDVLLCQLPGCNS
jgi:hypothetical protein